MEDLEKRLRGVEEMLALVLDAVKEPVRVSKARMKEGLPKGTGISIVDNDDEWVFALEVNDVD